MLQLSVEHRSAAAPEPLTIALQGTEQDMHLGMVHAQSPASQPAQASSPADQLAGAILEALAGAGKDGLTRDALRAAVRVRNERLGDALKRLSSTGQLAQRGDRWLPVPTLPLPEAMRNGNGNGAPSSSRHDEDDGAKES